MSRPNNRIALPFVEVRRGDSLSGIVRDVYGSFPTHQAWMTKTEEIAALNKSVIKNPNLIYPGQVLALTSNADVTSQSLGSKLDARDIEQFQQVWNSIPAGRQRELIDNYDFWETFMMAVEKGLPMSSALLSPYNLSLIQRYTETVRRGVRPPPLLKIQVERIYKEIIHEVITHYRKGLKITVSRTQQFTRTHRLFGYFVNKTQFNRYIYKLQKLDKLIRALKSPTMTRSAKALPLIVLTIQGSQLTMKIIEADDADEKRRLIAVDGGELLGGALGGGAAAWIGGAICATPGYGTLSCGIYAMIGVVLSGYVGANAGRLGGERFISNE